MQTNKLSNLLNKDHLTPEDLQDQDVRTALSAPTFRIFNKICEELGITIPQRCTLLGGVSERTYHNYQKGKISTFNYDMLERISLVLGIYKALKLIFVHKDRRKRWLTSKNTENIFDGKPPLDCMLQGSIVNLYSTRNYLDAWRGVK